MTTESDSKYNIDVLKTKDELFSFAKVLEAKGEQAVAAECKRRAFKQMAAADSASTELERDFWASQFAFEHIKAQRMNRKSFTGTRIRAMVKRWGVKETISRCVVTYGRGKNPAWEGKETACEEMIVLGLKDFTFEMIVMRHQNEFSDKCIAIAKQRLADLEAVKPDFPMGGAQ